jgi:glutaminase
MQDEFSIMSVSKPFFSVLVCEGIGAERARDKIGTSSTGLPFHSPSAIERSGDGRADQMVNAGAIAATSLALGAADDAKWQFVHGLGAPPPPQNRMTEVLGTAATARINIVVAEYSPSCTRCRLPSC